MLSILTSLNEEFLVHLSTIQLGSVFVARKACISLLSETKNRTNLSCIEHILPKKIPKIYFRHNSKMNEYILKNSDGFLFSRITAK